jgi:short-subunit dehydrogenase
MSEPRSIVITGASAGLGEALALAYARPGVRLGLVARRADKLSAIAEACRARGATVVVGALDLTTAGAIQSWMVEFQSAGPVDLVIANAGAFSGNRKDLFEPLGEAIGLQRINVEAVIATVDAALPAMKARRTGRIAIVSSLAALYPLADAPAYSASKAAVASYGEALREYLIDFGVGVTVIYPGHIKTQQTAVQVGDMPLMLSPETAAARIKRGLDAGRASITFPWPLLWLIWAGRLLPWRLRALAGRSTRFHVDPDRA